jgi:hypothetical protein
MWHGRTLRGSVLDNDKQMAQRIRNLPKDIIRDPEGGIGKP